MPNERTDAAKFMEHSEATQQRYYNLQQSEASDARMANIFAKMVKGEEVKPDELQPQIKSNTCSKCISSNL